jgi:hypothetical protein
MNDDMEDSRTKGPENRPVSQWESDECLTNQVEPI